MNGMHTIEINWKIEIQFNVCLHLTESTQFKLDDDHNVNGIGDGETKKTNSEVIRNNSLTSQIRIARHIIE